MSEPIDIIGDYKIEGFHAGTKTEYVGMATISKKGELYRIEWRSGPTRWGGIGILQGNTLAIAILGGKEIGDGVLICEVTQTARGPRLVGRWAYSVESTISTETLTFTVPEPPKPSPPEDTSLEGENVWENLQLPSALTKRIRAFTPNIPVGGHGTRPVTDCTIEMKQLGPLKLCMDTCGMEDEHPGSEWPWNILSIKSVIYSCGRLARRGDETIHDHDPAELSLCVGLANEAYSLAKLGKLAYGGEEKPYRPFFIAASRGAEVPDRPTAKWIRALFGGTIYPKAKPIEIFPLDDAGKLRDRLEEIHDSGDEDSRAALLGWKAMIQWFAAQPELHGSSFVRIGDDGVMADDDRNPSYYPILIVVITRKGSLVGICNALNAG